jgi:hypothetical protein
MLPRNFNNYGVQDSGRFGSQPSAAGSRSSSSPISPRRRMSEPPTVRGAARATTNSALEEKIHSLKTTFWVCAGAGKFRYYRTFKEMNFLFAH